MGTHSIAVIGGCNIDISATAFMPLIDGDSNPGEVQVTLGGVGRNVAENLTRLKHRVSLVSALGGDQFTELLRDRARAVGFDMTLSAVDMSMKNSIYVCVNQPDGEMNIAVSDMRVCELLTPAYLSLFITHLEQYDAIALDANIPQETIAYLADNCHAPMYADTVSSQKALRLKSILPHLHTLKTNRIEAQLLTGMKVREMDEVKACADKLHEIGVKQVFITLGADGAFASNGQEQLVMPSVATNIVNTTGCGDSFFSGVIAASLDALPLSEILHYGLCMSAICATERSAVAQSMSLKRLKAELDKQ